MILNCTENSYFPEGAEEKARKMYDAAREAGYPMTSSPALHDHHDDGSCKSSPRTGERRERWISLLSNRRARKEKR